MPRPPALAERLLRSVLPHGVVGDSIVGDTHEEFAEYVRAGGRAPRLWYWIHAGRLASGYVATRGRDVEVGTLLKDLKFGARALTRMPGSAAVAVCVLGIGIGLTSFMFSIVYGLYFRGLDVPDAHEVVYIYETHAERGETQRSVPVQNFADWRERQRSFDGLFASTGGTVNVAGRDQPVRFAGAFVTANTFGLLGVEPILGRAFEPGDDAPDAPRNIVLGYRAWRDRYGADPSVVGSAVRVNGEPGTILGVMPDGFEFPNNTEVWVPMRLDPLATARGQGPSLLVYGRLRDGVSRDQAGAEMASIASALEQEHPEVNEGISTSLLTPVRANMGGQLDLVFGAMLFAVLCVLLVACANVASLLLARAAMRTKEAGLRVAIGGSRFRVMLPFLAEAFVLSAAGALLGLGIAYAGVEWFDQVTDPSRTGRPWFMQFKIDLPILGIVMALTVFTALMAGIMPALKISRSDVNAVLKDESRGSSGLQIGRLSRMLVTAEVALSFALLVGAGLMSKSIVRLGAVDYPFETESVLTARVGLFAADYPDRDARAAMWADLERAITEIPRVRAATVASTLPYRGGGQVRVAIDTDAPIEPEELPRVNSATISKDYFAALGTSLLDGRTFSDQDGPDAAPVAIVNRPMVDRYFGGENPIGRQIRLGASDTLPLLTIVGIAPDLHMDGLEIQGEEFEPAGLYLPIGQSDLSFMSVAALTGGDATSLVGELRSAVQRVDADLPIYEVYTQAEVVDRQVWFFRVFGTVFIAFGAAALFMASVGLYGVLSFAVSRRTQEMGIRMALGAASQDVVRLVARQGAGQLGLGLGIGVLIAFGITRAIGLLMYQVDPQDPVVFASVFSLIVLVGMSAAVFPALRATGVDPVTALRSD